MNALSIWDKTVAIVRRDLLTAIRYRAGFITMAIGTGAELAAFYYLARAVGPEFRPEGLEYFPFLLVGTGFYTFLVSGINAFLTTVQEAQQTGTLEVLMTTSTPAPVLVFLSTISAFAGSTLQFALYLGAGLVWFGSGLHADVTGCVVIFFLSLGIAAAFGMFAAALQLAVQKGSAVVWLLGSGAWFMTGTLFPVSTLPKPLQIIAQWIPVTHCMDAMRLAMLQGASFGELKREILILAGFCGVLLPLSLVLFSFALRRARQLGTLSFY